MRRVPVYVTHGARKQRRAVASQSATNWRTLRRMSKSNGKAKSQPGAKDVFDNLIRALVPKAKKDETPEQEAGRMEAAVRAIAGVPLSKIPLPVERKVHSWSSALHGAVALRWNCAAKTLRKFFPRPGDQIPWRRPSLRSNAQFFRDLAQYGGAKFTKTGALDKSSMNSGPDAITYLGYTQPGSDARPEA